MRFLRQLGFDLSAQRAHKVTLSDFQRFDLILAMDASHLGNPEAMRPRGARARAKLFLTYHPSKSAFTEVPDPYYGSPAGFERELDFVGVTSPALLI